MASSVLQSLRLLVLLLLLCCVVYPGIVYVVGQTIFAQQANGSIIKKNGTIVGSALIGQHNNLPQYFWPRPSVNKQPYMPASATSSNLPYVSKAYKDAIEARYQMMREAHPYFSGEIPIDMVTTSASGLDPHISPHAAYMQVIRVARARNIGSDELYELIDSMVEEKQWGVFGARRINVLKLNLALDEAYDE